MSTANDIKEIELTIEEAQKVVEFGEVIRRLQKNRDFRTVIIDGYFRDEASRLTLLSADQALDDRSRERTIDSIKAIGELHQFFRTKVALADQMAHDIAEAKEHLDQLRAEEAGDDAAADPVEE